MLSKEMIKVIKLTEESVCGTSMLRESRIMHFQLQDLSTIGVEYDSAFDDFKKELEAVLRKKVYRPTAKKILNNWYAWAIENVESVSHIKG